MCGSSNLYLQFVRGFVVLVGLVVAGQATAQSTPFKSKKISALEYGVFCALHPMNSTLAPGTVEGWILVPDATPKFHWKTRQVPASKSIAFGVQARAASGELLGAVLTVSHPAIKNRKTDSWPTNFHHNQMTTDFYRFDFPYEMVPGEWVFQAVLDGEVLYQVSFDVVPAGALPEIVAACQE